MAQLCSLFHRKWQQLCHCCCPKLACCYRSLSMFFQFLLLNASHFWVELLYFMSLSSLGFLCLKSLKPRINTKPGDLDLFFTSVSAATVSSMSTVEMEVFSNPQLLILTLLMFVGGEVFTSMVGLFLRSSKLKKLQRSQEERVASVASSKDEIQNIELGVIEKPESPSSQMSSPDFQALSHASNKTMFPDSLKFLAFVVLFYLFAMNITGSILVSVYMALVSSARNILKTKGLNLLTFSIFTTVSTFASCGFVPTNENMIVFAGNSVLLLILIPQILFGNTLFPPCLRLCLWLVGKLGKKTLLREHSEYLLKNTEEIGYLHLLPARDSNYLTGTVVGFIAIQVTMFSAMEWNSESLSGLGGLRRFIGALFQCVNSRHTGETIVDLSVLTPAILVLFILMMYLPPYTSYLPIINGEIKKMKGVIKIKEKLIFSQLSYLVIFIILICVTERQRMKEDPLNFNVLTITLEVISAYGNVGFTTGYSCERRVKNNDNCEDKWFGFAGKWSDEGKIILIIVMIFGRLKKFNMRGGRAWRLL